MTDEEQAIPAPDVPQGETTSPRPVDERFRDLAELEEEIRRRLRSNQRFLERFLDDDFIDEEGTEAEETDDDDEEL